jgi:two-component system, NarL family, nitrate/nitrite response regulator NarL
MSKTRADVRILLSGHNGLFREGLKTLLEEQPGFRVVGEAFDGKEVTRVAELTHPDILVLEAEFPDLSILESVRSLQNAHPKLKIILLVADMKKNQSSAAFETGVRGIILKESAANSLFKCISAVMEGKFWIPGKGISDLPQLRETNHSQGIETAPAKFGLTKREMQILTLVAAGRTNREIAKRVSISEQTVKHHVTNIFDKIGVYNRLELALFAVHHGLTTSAALK